MTPRITLLVASLHALLYVALSLRVVLLRKGRGVGIGTGGDAELARAVRVHGNFAEYVPLALLLLALLELAGTPSGLLWAFGLGLLLARVLHALGLARASGYSVGRFGGTLLTFLLLAAMAATGLWRVLAATAS